MRLEDHYNNNEATGPHPSRSHSFFFFEASAGRTYFRFTRLAVALIAAFIIIPIASIMILFLLRPAMDETKVDVTIHPLPSPASSNVPLIIQPPAPRPPQALRQQTLPPAPSPPVLESTPGTEINRQKQTPNPPAPQPRVP